MTPGHDIKVESICRAVFSENFQSELSSNDYHIISFSLLNFIRYILYVTRDFALAACSNRYVHHTGTDLEKIESTVFHM